MSDYTFIIILTFVGFTALAALLLVPVYRFLKREEHAGNRWTAHQLRHTHADPDDEPASATDASTRAE